MELLLIPLFLALLVGYVFIRKHRKALERQEALDAANADTVVANTADPIEAETKTPVSA